MFCLKHQILCFCLFQLFIDITVCKAFNLNLRLHFYGCNITSSAKVAMKYDSVYAHFP